jgi:hypothetical protein
MNIDEILKDLLSKDNGVIIGLDQKQMLLENWDLVALGQKKELLQLLDREGLYTKAMLKIEVETDHLISRHE